MDREYLEDYEQKENDEFERLVLKKFEKGKYDFEKDKYPPDERFPKLQKPVAQATQSSLWAQIPFCGSLVISLAPVGESHFERWYFKVSEIPKVISFIKETGRLQVVFGQPPTDYESFDFLEPFFTDLNAPVSTTIGSSYFWGKEETKKTTADFQKIGQVGYFNFIREITQKLSLELGFPMLVKMHYETYLLLKLGRYSIVEEIEKLMINNPRKAFTVLNICFKFIAKPFFDIRCDSGNFRLDEIAGFQALPFVPGPKELYFPCEIGKFLLRKLTYAPYGMDACKELMYHYDAYDLQKVQKSLNEAILTNQPDIVNKSTEEFSEILDNIWKDPEIPKLVKNLRRGIPISIAAIGTGVSVFTGGLESFLAGLGVSVGAKFLDVEIKGLSERIAKWLTRNHQANIYDFKKKYKHRIVQE